MHDKMIALIVFGAGALVLNYFWHKNSAMTDKIERIKQALRKFSKDDQMWDEVLLKKVAKKTFEEYHEAMETFHTGEFDAPGPDFNYQEIKHLLHSNATWEVKGGNRDRFRLESVLAQKKYEVNINIIHARDSSDDNKDCFTACFDALDFEILQPVVNFTTIHLLGHRRSGTFNKSFEHGKEFWTFQRSGNKWLLLCIHDEHNWEMFTQMRILEDEKKKKTTRRS